MTLKMEEFHNLAASREILKSSIEKSRDIAIAIDQSGSRLKETSHNMSILQAAIKNMACKCAVYDIRGPVDRALGPSAAVLKVLDVVHELQDSVLMTDPSTDLYAYLANIKRLQQALKLLADNCRLVILWLQDVVQFLKNINVESPADGYDWYIWNISKVMKILMELQGREVRSCQNGGVLASALDKLESEYRHLLIESFPFPGNMEKPDFASFPAPVIQDLQAITEVLSANNRLDRCKSIYAEVRTAKARVTLQALNIDYLGIQLSEFDSVETIDGYIDMWDKHMEFAVRHLLQMEYKLCSEVYWKARSDVGMECFAKISSQCGFSDIFNFGIRISKCKKDAIKLLKLLKIFATLDKLRLDFNELFSGKFCVEIQNQTRDLVKRVVDGAYEIFWELLIQVELQRASSPPLDGSVPRLVCFVTEYCNQLLEDENSSILTRILEIHQEWNHMRFEEGLLSNEIHNIMKALELNLETWAKKYNDTALSCLFMTNNYWYLCNNTRATKLGEVMGNSWLWAHEESTEYYAALYTRESWEKLLVLLCEEGLTLFPGGRAIDRNLVKKRIGIFSDAFDDMYKKQSKWIMSDKALRWKTCQLVAEAVVPCYKCYLEKFLPEAEIEREIDTGNHIRYTAKSLENKINSLFQMKLGKYGSNKCTDIIGIKNGVINHFSSTSAAA